MPIQFVQKDKGGTIYHDVADVAPSRWDNSPAPTVTIKNRTGGELVASQSATLGPSTTLSETAAAKTTIITVAATTDISVGDVLILGPNSSGQWEWVTVDSVNSSSKEITLRDKLK